MKRFLSVILILSMLLMSCAMLASCGGDKEGDDKTVDTDPLSVLGNAAANTTASFFENQTALTQVLEAAMTKGSIKLTADGGLLDAGFDEISETLYFDTANKLFVSDTVINVENETYSGRLFFNDQSIALKSESLLGTKDVLQLNFSEIESKFPNSDLAAMLGIEQEDMNEMMDALKEFSAQATEDKALQQKMDAAMEKILKALGETMTEGELEQDGETVKCTVITYTLNNTALKAMIDVVVKDILKDFMDADSYQEMVAEMGDLDEMDEYVDIDVTVTMYVNAKAGTLAQIKFDGEIKATDYEYVIPKYEVPGFTVETMSDDEYVDVEDPSFDDDFFMPEENWETEVVETTIKVDATMDFTDKAITLKGNLEADGEKIGVDVSLTKKSTDEKLTYTLVVKATANKATLEFLNASYTYNKDTGKIALAAEISTDGSTTASFNVNGKLTLAKDSFTLKISKISYESGNENMDMEMDIAIAVTAGGDIPEMPTNTKNILDMDEAQLGEIMSYIEENFGGFAATPDLPGGYVHSEN